MIFRCAILILFTASTFFFAAAEEETQKSRMREVLKARATEEAKKKSTPPAPAKTEQPPATSTTTTAPEKDVKTGGHEASAAAPAAQAAKETQETPPLVLPKVEVRKDRITELDRQLHQQAKEIAREKKNTRATEVDKALNDSKVSKALAIFGGESSQHRTGIAQERIELMEAESDLMEAIAHAKTKEEKHELEKQLDQLKAIRRDLEKSLR